MSEFKREERYLVLKIKRMGELATSLTRDWVNEMDINDALTECVVVESDWPIYEQVWDMVRGLAEDKPNQIDRLREALNDCADKITQRDLKLEQIQTTNQQLVELAEECAEFLSTVSDYEKPLTLDDRLAEAITNAKQQEKGDE